MRMYMQIYMNVDQLLFFLSFLFYVLSYLSYAPVAPVLFERILTTSKGRTRGRTNERHIFTIRIKVIPMFLPFFFPIHKS